MITFTTLQTSKPKFYLYCIVQMNRAKHIVLDLKALNFSNRNQVRDPSEAVLERITKYIKDKKIKIKTGDVIAFQALETRNRNGGVSLWNGKKAISLFYDIDDYGSVPPSIKVTKTKFNPLYWVDTIMHNEIIWLAPGITNGLVFYQSWMQNHKVYRADTTIGRQPWSIIVQKKPKMTPASIKKAISSKKVYFEARQWIEVYNQNTNENPWPSPSTQPETPEWFIELHITNQTFGATTKKPSAPCQPGKVRHQTTRRCRKAY
jgi:hypothetical protein